MNQQKNILAKRNEKQLIKRNERQLKLKNKKLQRRKTKFKTKKFQAGPGIFICLF